MKIRLIASILTFCLLWFLFLYTCDEPERISQATIEEVSKKDLSRKKLQSYEVNLGGKEEYIIGKQGTLLVIPPDAFIDENGAVVKGKVEVEMIEINQKEDFVTSRIQTASNGNLLSSAGSYYFNAKDEKGKVLRINPENKVKAAFPTMKKDPEMQLFKGVLDKDSSLNWVLLAKETFDLKKPKEPNFPEYEDLKAQKFLHDIKAAKETLWKIDNGSYEYSEGSWIPTEGNEDWTWDATYINRLRRWVKYNKKREKYFLAENKKINQRNYLIDSARSVYLRKLWDYKKEAKESIGTSDLEYELDEMGWYNCDKFVREEMIAYKGSIQMENGKPAEWMRVHLISTEEMIHLTQVSEDGTFSFQYPKGKPFQILAFRGDFKAEGIFDGSTTELEPITVKPNSEILASL